MSVKILNKIIVAPLVILLAVAPLLCCCFEGVAWAAPKVTVEQSPKGCAHCDKKNQPASQKQDTHDCDCPHILAESGSLKIVPTDTPSVLTDEFSGFSPVAGTIANRGGRTVLFGVDKHYPGFHLRRPLPAFLLYHTLRI